MKFRRQYQKTKLGFIVGKIYKGTDIYEGYHFKVLPLKQQGYPHSTKCLIVKEGEFNRRIWRIGSYLYVSDGDLSHEMVK